MPNPWIAGEPNANGFDIGPNRVTVPGNFVDKGHAASKKAVRRELGYDRRFRVSELQRIWITLDERRIQRLHELPRLLRVRSDDNPGRLREVADSCSLGQKL